MVTSRKVEFTRVADTVGVPLAPPLGFASTASSQLHKRPSTPIRPPVRSLKRVRITKERGNLTRSGYIYKAMTNLGEKASQLNYNVVQRGPRGEEVIQKVTNTQTTPEGEISGTVPALVYPAVPSKIQESKNLMAFNRPVRVQKVYIKWEEQQIGEDTYAKGRSPGYFASPSARPKPLPPVTPHVTRPVIPEAQNIRTTELRPDSARLEWDEVSMPGIAYKIWLDGVAKGTAVREPRIDLAGLTPGKRYKVEIRTQPYSKSDLRSQSKKVAYYFTTPLAVTAPPVTALKTIKIRRESIGHKGTIYKAETDLGANVSQFKYDVWQTIGRLTEQIEVKGKEVTKYGVISFTIPYSVQTSMDRRIAIKWREQEIAGQRYKAGWTEGVVIVTAAPPVTAPPVHIQPVPYRPAKRKLSARVEELMKKRGFPRAVKEAIEKGLERKEAPQDIERIIEKVAKTNEPDYILRRTIAKRIGVHGRVQYKVDTDKGTIIYENADEITVNAILGMPTPTGDVIPLQIKVIR